MFRAAEVIVINKIDRFPHVDFSLATAIAQVRGRPGSAAIGPYGGRHALLACLA